MALMHRAAVGSDDLPHKQIRGTDHRSPAAGPQKDSEKNR